MPSDDEEVEVDEEETLVTFLTVTAFGEDLTTFTSLGTEFTLLDPAVAEEDDDTEGEEDDDDCLEVDNVDTRFEEAVDAFLFFFVDKESEDETEEVDDTRGDSY